MQCCPFLFTRVCKFHDTPFRSGKQQAQPQKQQTNTWQAFPECKLPSVTCKTHSHAQARQRKAEQDPTMFLTSARKNESPKASAWGLPAGPARSPEEAGRSGRGRRCQLDGGLVAKGASNLVTEWATVQNSFGKGSSPTHCEVAGPSYTWFLARKADPLRNAIV